MSMLRVIARAGQRVSKSDHAKRGQRSSATELISQTQQIPQRSAKQVQHVIHPCTVKLLAKGRTCFTNLAKRFSDVGMTLVSEIMFVFCHVAIAASEMVPDNST